MNDALNYITADILNDSLEHTWEQLIAYRFPLMKNIEVKIFKSDMSLRYTGNDYHPSEIRQFINETMDNIINHESH